MFVTRGPEFRATFRASNGRSLVSLVVKGYWFCDLRSHYSYRASVSGIDGHAPLLLGRTLAQVATGTGYPELRTFQRVNDWRTTEHRWRAPPNARRRLPFLVSIVNADPRCAATLECGDRRLLGPLDEIQVLIQDGSSCGRKPGSASNAGGSDLGALAKGFGARVGVPSRRRWD